MIPFISQLSAAEQQMWLEALSIELPNENIVLASDVAPEQRQLCTIAIVANPDITTLSSFNNLSWLHSVWAGVEKLMANLQSSDIKITRLIDPMLSQTMAEAVLAWSLYLHRDMPIYAKQQQEATWLQHQYTPANERRIGILGLGELGCESAQRLQQNGFDVMGWSRSTKNLPSISTFSGQEGLLAMASRSDILVCLLPLTAETQGLINTELLEQMPKGSSVINFARGGIIDTDALLHTLVNNHIKHAVLDVFDQEPLPTDSKLWQQPNVTVLPHISAPTQLQSACKIVANNIIEYRKSGQLPVCVNKAKGY